MDSTLARFESSRGHPDTLVHAARHFTIALWIHVKTISSHPRIFGRMRRFMMKRVEACIVFHGGHFEHSLYMYIYSFSYNSPIKYFRTHTNRLFLSSYMEIAPNLCASLSITPFTYDKKRHEPRLFNL
jgi:hypothetical protein